MKNIMDVAVPASHIDIAEQYGACPDAIVWLRESARTYGDVIRAGYFPWASLRGLLPLLLRGADLRGADLRVAVKDVR